MPREQAAKEWRTSSQHFLPTTNDAVLEKVDARVSCALFYLLVLACIGVVWRRCTSPCCCCGPRRMPSWGTQGLMAPRHLPVNVCSSLGLALF